MMRKNPEISAESERSLPLFPLFLKNYFSIDKDLGLANVIDACVEGRIWWMGLHSHQWLENVCAWEE